MAPTTRKRPSKVVNAEVNLSDDEKEQIVDEPDELQDLSEEEWTPVDKKGRTSVQRSGPLSKKKKGNFDKDDSDEEETKKRPTKAAAKGKSAKANGKKLEDSEEEEVSDEDCDDEESEEGGSDNEKGDETSQKEFPSGSFVVLKSQFDTMEEPPIWRIDGKTLLQKYLPHKADTNEVNLYISTCSFNFWNSKVKDQYYPVTVKYRHQKGVERVVEFQRDSVQKNGTDTASNTTTDTAPAAVDEK